MKEKSIEIQERKKEHLEILLKGEIDPVGTDHWLDCVSMVHQALPELSLEEIDLSTRFAGKSLKAPLFICGMTGGTSEAGRINRGLARVAEGLGIGFGLGSQRAMLEDSTLAESYRVRHAAPKVLLAGNIGAVQAAALGSVRIQEMLDEVEADWLCLHLNPAQEMIQPEGDRDFRGLVAAIGRLVVEIKQPLIVKEVGCGISRESALRLLEVGVGYLDLAGTGGTSFVGIEIERSDSPVDDEASAFRNWGIPTAASLLELTDLPLKCMASGGIRSGLDAARAIVLGAEVAGLAAPVLRAFISGGEQQCLNLLEGIMDNIKRVMLLTGSKDIPALQKVPRVITGKLHQWSSQRCV